MLYVKIHKNCIFQSCPTKCSSQKDCIRCRVWDEGELAEKNCEGCEHLNIEIRNSTNKDCEFLEDNCWYYFDIENENGNESVDAVAVVCNGGFLYQTDGSQICHPFALQIETMTKSIDWL